MAAGVVVQANAEGAAALGRLLTNVTNLRAEMSVTVLVVCFGPGLDLVLPGGELTDLVAGQLTAGVGFAACANTMRGRDLAAEDLLVGVEVVPAGVAEIARRQLLGWAYFRP